MARSIGVAVCLALVVALSMGKSSIYRLFRFGQVSNFSFAHLLTPCPLISSSSILSSRSNDRGCYGYQSEPLQRLLQLRLYVFVLALFASFCYYLIPAHDSSLLCSNEFIQLLPSISRQSTLPTLILRSFSSLIFAISPVSPSIFSNTPPSLALRRVIASIFLIIYSRL